MSASTAPQTRRLHHTVLAHARRPHGLLIIGILVFIAAWFVWTMVYAPYATT